MKQHCILSRDEVEAVAWWSNKEVKVWAVDIAAGRERRPAYRHTYYARARTADQAFECVKQNLHIRVPGARYRARLAGPRELGCHEVAAGPTPLVRHTMAVGFDHVGS
ncbi:MULTISPECIES: hypothetical protein [Burkholderia cepacia complex]|nr:MULTISPECIES: hypothetical protein [Burkholderia cepacia complex]ALV61647.1 hypothetical protein TQ36_36075 [Burkholderia cenocepacia]AQQ48084.1 hypothetical protein A8F32_19655 [Burkholderia cenocepacia]MCA7888339.1 hypothetical protein [Burkholderia contaminans]ONJ04198.1 hypothetical protein A8F33_23845 [Burkholderia cenocepacia]ONJ09532.1 hypothetical protein A8F53_00745 [Burkholderia cenocepacia]